MPEIEPGTQIRADGQRYPTGTGPAEYDEPAEVRVAGDPAHGEVPRWDEALGRAEWSPGAGGGDAASVSFDDTGLIVVTGVVNVQTALALVDGALVDRPTDVALPATKGLSLGTKNTTATGAMQQWGGDITFDNALLPADVTVEVTLTGSARRVSTNAEAGSIRVRISLDGGSSWTNSPTPYWHSGNSPQSGNATPVAASLVVSGAVTGDVIVQAQCQTDAANGQPSFTDGYLEVTVKAQHAAEA